MAVKFQVMDTQDFNEFDELNEFNIDTNIKVFGIGGAGGNAVTHMVESAVQGVEFIAANTDRQALYQCLAEIKLELGNSGLGAGAKPEKGREAAEEKIDEIRQLLEGANMVFITAGMGGGTGTGGAPLVAKIAKEMGILTVGVVTKPFKFEGNRRIKAANAGINELTENVDSLIVVLNDKLLEVLGEDATADECFKAADDVLKNAVNGIVELIHKSGLINVDFEDVRTVMTDMGRSMMGVAMASGVDRARIAAQQAIASPLLDGVNLATAKGILINIAGSRHSLKMKECMEVMGVIEEITENRDEDYIVMGAVYDESLEDEIKVTVVATGLDVRTQKIPEIVVTNPNLKTGTDNIEIHTPAVNRRNRHVPNNLLNAEKLANSGVDHFTIPAFLRKQAD